MKAQAEAVLRQLQALSLGPLWVESNYSDPHQREEKTPPAKEGWFESDAQNIDHEKGVEEHESCFVVDFRPNGFVIDRLIRLLKSSFLTYRFDSLVRLFLEKPDRFDVVISAVKGSYLYCVGPEKQPFLHKKAAEAYWVNTRWDDFFEERHVHVGSPKGAFKSVNYCGITGILLGPPNYHLYGDLIREHYNERLKDFCTWKDFIAGIKNSHDERLIRDWFESKTYVRFYIPRKNSEMVFQDYYSAKQYLLEKTSADKQIIPTTHIRFPYADLEKLQDKEMKAFVKEEKYREVRNMRRLGNNCRICMYRAGIHFYKRAKSLGCHVYVCAVKRNVRDEFTSLPDDLTAIIECIAAHPLIKFDDLLKQVSTMEPWADAPIDVLVFKQKVIQLVRQGFVTQYENGLLYVSPKQTRASKMNQKKVKV